MTEKIYLKLIVAVSILIPCVVALLLYKPAPLILVAFDVTLLPKLNAVINSIVTVLLICGLILIKNKKIYMHKICMITAFIFSVVFLISYVIYHANTNPIPYGGAGLLKYIYYFILITHVILAIFVVPLALMSLFRGLRMEITKHKKIVRWSFPLWLYVSITGVIVYLMISPYYTMI